MSTKHMSPEEFESWAAKHSAGEILERAVELQNELVTDLAETVGVDSDAYAQAGSQEKEMIVTAGAEQWLDEQAEREEPEPVEAHKWDFGTEDGVAIEMPAGELSDMIGLGLTRTTLRDDSLEAQKLAQSIFCAKHPEYTKSVANGNALRDRLEENGHTYFTVEALEEAMQQLVFEGKIEIPYEFGR